MSSFSILDTALAAAAMSQPIRVVKRSGGMGYICRTNKGENTPADVTAQDEKGMQQFFEQVLKVIDEKAPVPPGAKDEDAILKDQHTSPPWFGHYKHMGAYYVMSDIPVQLDPNRGQTMWDPIMEVADARSLPFSEAELYAARETLDKQCSRGSSCNLPNSLSASGQGWPRGTRWRACQSAHQRHPLSLGQ